MAQIPTINANQIIQRNIQRFPQSADDLIKAKQYYDKLEENQLYRLKNELARGNQLTAKDANLPARLLEPGVIYKRDWLGNKLDPYTRPDGLPNGGYVDFIGYSKVPMGDWDFPEITHPDSSITIQHLGDVYDNLARYTTDNPGSKWQTYLTPGGVRAFDVSRQLTPRQFNSGKRYGVRGDFKQLNIDPNYAKMAVNQSNPTRIVKYNNLYPEQAWNVRVSGKPGRPEDFVAFPLGTVGNAPTNPYNQRVIDEYHDLAIMRSMVLDGMQAGKLPPSGLELLEYHLNTVPNNYKYQIESNLERMRVF